MFLPNLVWIYLSLALLPLLKLCSQHLQVHRRFRHQLPVRLAVEWNPLQNLFEPRLVRLACFTARALPEFGVLSEELVVDLKQEQPVEYRLRLEVGLM